MNEPVTKSRIHPLTIWIPVIIIALGMAVFWNYLIKLQREKQQMEHLPKLSRLEKNLVLIERSGKNVEIKDLKGKVIVACWVFTRCPRGCPGVVGEMLRLYNEIGDDPSLHFLSVSVDPDDKPEQLREFTDRLKIKGDNWWFVNGNRDELRVYMTRYFGFQGVQDVPEKDRLTPDDKFIHDMKVALVDHAGHVRGFYDIGSSDKQAREFFQEKIRKDIITLKAEQNKSGRSPVWFFAFVGLMAACVITLIWVRVREGARPANT